MRGSKGEVAIKENKARGRYEARLTIGRNPDGSQRRQLVTGKSRAEVRRKIDTARKAVDEGRDSRPDRRTVGQYLDAWLEDVLPGTVTPSTEANYRSMVELYIKPAVGGIDLVKLAPLDVSKMLRKMAKAGKSANTQRLARSVLRRALRYAERDGTVTRNAAALADGVKLNSTEGRTLTVEQARQLLDVTEHERLGAAWVLAMTVGLRRGELLGLTWDDLDIDSDTPSVTIRRALKRIPHEGLEVSEVKTAGSRRRVRLPSQTVDRLKRHRENQDLERMVLGKAWPAKPLGVDLVFRSPIGTAVDPDNFRNDTYRLTLELFTPEDERPKEPGDKWPTEYRWSPHELRHSAASLMLAQGVPLKVISEVLGHSSIRITGDVYAHLMEESTGLAADAMSDLFSSD